MNNVIKVENIGKQYRLGKVGTGTISHDLNRWWHTVRGREDPYLKIGEINDRSTKGSSDYIWALKNINFEVQQGQVLGIIGRNGAGKSTLLKILSRTTSPTTGVIKIKGRVASLLEVGTGFHPELSGRENVFLNGAILGMRKDEILRKFDEIVDFAGVERYIDTPVKRYSSGMYVRLAFGVAAHLEPEILIVDEVLAVGDAEFQKKCLGKMKDVSVNEGRTVLFVSHNINAVQKLCDKGLLMVKGCVEAYGKIDEVINQYLINKLKEKYTKTEYDLTKNAQFTQVEPIDKLGLEKYEFKSGEEWGIKAKLRINRRIDHCIVGLCMYDQFDTNIRTSWSPSLQLETGIYELYLREKTVIFRPGVYSFDISISSYETDIEYLKLPFSVTINEVVANKILNQSVNLNFGIVNNLMEYELKII